LKAGHPSLIAAAPLHRAERAIEGPERKMSHLASRLRHEAIGEAHTRPFAILLQRSRNVRILKRELSI